MLIAEQYSKTQVKQKDDTNAKDMVNPFRFTSSSPKRYRVWSPELSFEERYRLKRQREDEYVQEFRQEDRPILLIKQKHAYNNVQNPDLFEEPGTKENYYKISKNTQLVDDIGKEIQDQHNFTRKQTVVHEKKNKSQNQDDTSVYKIDGLEFLPEGFIELDPLLYKDEFEFESRVHENFFIDEQRRIKALRRKQYEQRNYQKMRDVTIFLVDERKDQIIDYLEKWYFKHKRRMNQEEIDYVAQLLKCDPQTMKDLQDLFLEKKKYLNSKLLREYLTKHGRIRDDKLIVPPSLKKYFIKQKNPYDHVKARVYNQKGEYVESKGIHNKRLKSPFSKRIRSSKSTQNIGRNNQQNFNASGNLQQKKQLQKKQLQGNFSQDQNNQNEQTSGNTSQQQWNENNRIVSVGNLNKISKTQLQKELFTQTQEQVKQSSQEKDKLIKTDNFEKRRNFNEGDEENDELRMYFDSEVNKILDKIEGSKIKNKQEKCEVDIGGSKKLMNCKYVLEKQESEKYIQNYKEKVLQDSLKKLTPIEKNISLQNPSAHFKKSKDLKTNLEKINEKVLKQEDKIEHYPEMDTFGNNKNLQANPEILNSEVDDKAQISKRNKTVTSSFSDQSNFKRVTIATKIDDNNVVIQQKLKPFNIYGEFYYQIVEDILKDGVRSVHVVTKNDRGQILNIQEIPIELQTDNYENNLIEEPNQFDGDKKCILVVTNSKGQTVALNTIRPQNNSTLGLDTKENFLNNGNFRKSLILERNIEDGIKRVHTLIPVMIFGKLFQQKVVEEIKNSEKFISVITTNNQGGIIFQENFQLEKESNHYYSQVSNDFVDEQGIREVVLETKNELGDTIASHSIRQTEDENSQIFKDTTKKFRQTTLKTKQNDQNLTRAHTFPPLILGNEYVRQQVIETTDRNGNRNLSVLIQNQQGEIVQQDKIESEMIADGYAQEIIKDEIQNDGKRVFTVVTKNDRGETISVNKIRPTINSVLGEDFFDSFIQESKGKKTIISSQDLRGTKTTTFQLSPTIVGNQYYQQVIEEVTDGLKKNTSILTKTQQGQMVSKETIKQKLTGDNFQTEVQINNEDPQLYDLITKDDNNQTISKITLRPIFSSVIDNNYLKDFELNKKGTSIIGIRKTQSTINREQSLRPTKVGENVYQQIINEVVDSEGEKSVIVVTKDEKGNLLQAQEITTEVSTEQCTPQISQTQRGVTIVIKNNKGETLAQQMVEENQQNKSQENFQNSSISKITIDKKKNTILHSLRPTTVGQHIYQQTVEEFLNDKGDKKLTVITKNENGEIINQKEVDNSLKGRNYQSIVSRDFIDNEGKRKVILETKNDKNQILSELEIFPQDLNKEKYYDGKNEEDLNQNEIQEIKKDSTLVKKSILRPTFIGNEYYQHVIEEQVGQDGKKNLTLVTLDNNNQELGKQQLNPQLIGKNYSVSVVKDEVDQNLQKYVSIVIRNENGAIVAEQKLQSTTAGDVQQYGFSDHFDVYDEKGKRQTTISVKREQNFVFRTHALNPILVGSNFYQQTVNEVLEDDGTKSAMVVTTDENGKIISRDSIQPELIGEFYSNRITEDIINEEKERVVTIETLNDQGQVVAKRTFKPTVMQQIGDNYFQDTLLETVDENGNQKVYQFEKQNSKSQKVTKFSKSTLFPIKEEENDFEKKKQKNKYFENLIEGNKIERDPNRFTQIQKEEKKVQFSTMQVKDIDRKSKPKNYTARKIKSQVKKNKEEKIEEEKIVEEKIENEEKEIKKSNSDQDLIENIRDSFNLEGSQQNQQDNEYKQEQPAQNIFNSSVVEQRPTHLNSVIYGYEQQNQSDVIMEEKIQDEISNFQEEEKKKSDKNIQEHHDFLIQKSEKLKGYLDDYINTLKKSKLDQMKKTKEKEEQEEFLKKTIEDVFNREKEKLGDEIVKKIENKVGSGNQRNQDDLMEEFYKFCRERLPQDHNYKESIMFVSLFYYFMEKKNLLKQFKVLQI